MEAPPRKLPPKKDVLEAFLSKGSARVFVDPRRANVLVPKWFAKQPELVLRVGHSLSPPIPDLVVTDEAVSCTLSFNRSPFWCKMPWSAVFAVVSDVDGRGVVWPDDVPLESQLLKPTRQKPKLASVPPKETTLHSVPNPPPSEAAPRRSDAAPSPTTGAQLGLVTDKAEDRTTESAAPTESEASAVPAPDAKDAEAPTSEDTSSSDSDSEETQGKKPKRQLPPYLRVVK